MFMVVISHGKDFFIMHYCSVDNKLQFERNNWVPGLHFNIKNVFLYTGIAIIKVKPSAITIIKAKPSFWTIVCLTHIWLEMHGCVLSHQATSIHIADWIFIMSDQFHTEILRLWTTILPPFYTENPLIRYNCCIEKEIHLNSMLYC